MTAQKRPYRLKRRAETEQRTRLGITESAVDLHGTLGPARTSISAIARRAGVRRSTVYRHFPDEASLFSACTSRWMAANPFPDIDRWMAIDDPAVRLMVALGSTTFSFSSFAVTLRFSRGVTAICENSAPLGFQHLVQPQT